MFVPLQIEVTPDETVDGGIVVAARGELDIGTFEVLDEQHRVHTRACRPMRIDLSGIAYVDSAGLASLILARQRADEHGVPLVFGPLSAQVKAAFALAGLRPDVTRSD